MPNEDEKVKEKMQEICKSVDDLLPNGYGFVVLAFQFGEIEGRQAIYGSNCDRQDILRAMKEWIEKTENNYGNDTGKY